MIRVQRRFIGETIDCVCGCIDCIFFGFVFFRIIKNTHNHHNNDNKRIHRQIHNNTASPSPTPPRVCDGDGENSSPRVLSMSS